MEKGIGIPGVLFVLFVGLKLAEVGPVAVWSWWWVSAPLWVPAALLLAFAGFCGIMAVLTRQVSR